MKPASKLIVVPAILFVLAQFIRPGIPTKPATAEVNVPGEIREILSKDCYSCHSDERRLAWFDEIQPGYTIVRHDILTAREHLNFSTLGTEPPAVQRAKLFEAVSMIQLGAMPLPQFVALHPGARVKPEELATLKAYLAPWGQNPPSAATAQHVGTHADTGPLLNLASVKPAPNGLPFEPGFEDWHLLSSTDRGDNNTFRFILGNEISVQAVESGHLSPWPDGARLAKVAWQQELGADGLVHPGKFVQIEIMVKDARVYKKTDGWGWGRWRGPLLKPYGVNAGFVTECTGCHLPVRGNDSVYTQPITQVHIDRSEVTNEAAALPSSLPWQPLNWKPITMYVNRNDHTMTLLFGNELAMKAVEAQRGSGSFTQPSYSSGSVLALVTWKQREDPHWFGARIPDRPLSVEFVSITPQASEREYRLFAGDSLLEKSLDAYQAQANINRIVSLMPVGIP